MKNLTLAEGVVLTPSITRTLDLIDPYFDGERSVVTSGLRTTNKQLSIIIEKAKRHGLDKIFTEFAEGLDLDGKPRREIEEEVDLRDGSTVFWWQPAWSRLLSLGDYVNPPVRAKVLEDYKRDGILIHAGATKEISDHQRGIAFDIGGGQPPSRLSEKAERVMRANQSGKCFIVAYLIERVNNAVHVDCAPTQNMTA